MPRRRGRAAGLVLGLLAVVASGCDVFVPPPQPPCPPVDLIEDVARIVQFRPGPGRDITDVAYVAEFRDVIWSCDHSETVLMVDLEILIKVGRGPTAEVGDTVVRYFVALSDRADRIIAKRVFDIPVELAAGEQVDLQEAIGQRIGLQPGQTGTDFVILLGFQLDRDQLEYNRERLR